LLVELRLTKTARGAAMEAPQELLAALAAHGEKLAAELRALDDMPQAKLTPASVFDRAKPPGSVAQQRGVICRLRCCGKPIDQKCNDRTGDAACPTHVMAARMLRSKIAEQHGSAACLAKAKQKLSEESSGSSGPVESAFSVMMGAQLVRQRAGSELMQAEEDLQLLRSRLAAAEERLEAAQVEAWRMGLGAKKPRAPEWQGREYSAWDKIDTWRQEEGRIYKARRQKLSADVAVRQQASRASRARSARPASASVRPSCERRSAAPPRRQRVRRWRRRLIRSSAGPLIPKLIGTHAGTAWAREPWAKAWGSWVAATLCMHPSP